MVNIHKIKHLLTIAQCCKISYCCLMQNLGKYLFRFLQGRTYALLNFPALFSDWSMIWSVHFIDQSEKSEIVKFCFGVHYPEKNRYHEMSK